MIPENLLMEVHMLNETKKVLYNEAVNVIPQLAKYVGKKILNADGHRAKSFAIDLLKAAPTPYKDGAVTMQSLYLERGHTYYRLCVSLCFSGGSYEDRTAYTMYMRNSVMVGEVDEKTKQVLESVVDLTSVQWLKGTIDAKKEYAQILKYKALKKELEKIEKKVDDKFYEKDYY